MSQKFENLSPEGKLDKIRQHADKLHPVSSTWVRWLLDEFVPDHSSHVNPDSEIVTAFQELDSDSKMSKVKQRMAAEPSIPASWVVWLLDEYVPDANPQETNKVAGGKTGFGL